MIERLRRAGAGLADVVVGGGWLVGAMSDPRRAGVRGLGGMVAAAARHGQSLGSIVAVAAARAPDAVVLVDDDGPVRAAALQRRASALAAAMDADGVGAGDAVGVLARNGRGFVEAVTATSQLGADLVLLNTEFAAESLGATISGEEVATVVHDAEFVERLTGSGHEVRRFCPTEIPEQAEVRPPRRRLRKPGRIVVLTSGTTGAAKGARQSENHPAQIVPITSMLRAMRLRADEPMLVLPPMFHGYGFSFLLLGLATGMPIVTSRRYTATGAVVLAQQHRVGSIVAVPPMLPAIIAALDEDGGGGGGGGAGELSELRRIICGSGQLHPSVSESVLRRFGPVLFNLYGSTEEGWSTIATPADLATAPGTIGRPVAGVDVELLGDDERPVADGEVGHLCVRSSLSFGGYTHGGERARRGGMLDSGDLAHLDRHGLLHIDGRADGMVVTGGENVFLVEVEDALLTHPDVVDARVDGVADETYGTRIEASVVLTEDARSRIDAAALQRHVQSRLARYKVPRRFQFVDSLPATATGKHVRR